MKVCHWFVWQQGRNGKLKTFGLPQRGKGAEVAEIGFILCVLCLSAPLRPNERSCEFETMGRSQFRQTLVI